MEEYKKTANQGRIWRTIAVIVVAALFIIIMIVSLTSKPAPGDRAWNQATTIGNLEAKNYYIMYTDLMCPYCDVFSRATMEHWDEFQQYLSDNDILFEVRLTDYLYEGNDIAASRNSAEGAYCAMRENKFWDYYHGALQSLWDDYHSKGIGTSKTAPQIQDMPDDYWRTVGHEAGLGEDFDKCLDEHATIAEIEDNTRRALQVAQGMPFFQFNKFTTAGFDNNWGWDYVLKYLNAGLSSK